MLLEAKIKNVQNLVAYNYTTTVEKELLTLKAEYNRMSADRAATDIIRLNQTFYEQGEKTGKLLAWQIKQLETRKAITSIRKSNGDIVTNPVEINKELKEFYGKLYDSETPNNVDCRNTFWKILEIPQVPNKFAKILEADLKEMEISKGD